MLDVDFKRAHCLNAVLGWLQLGNTKEAQAELETLGEEYRSDSNVLDVQWLLYARDAKWSAAFEVAERLIEVAPELPAGWLHRSYALRRKSDGGVAPAAKALLPAFEMFPKDATIPFNLACYACQLAELEEARGWLREAFKRGNRREIKKMALTDTDLELLWPEIKKW